MDMSGGCKLQVSEVENLEQYRRLIGAGVGRIVTTRAWEIYNEWMLEVEKIDFPELTGEVDPQILEKAQEEEKSLLLPPNFIGRESLLPLSERKLAETPTCCKTDGAELKFL